ncbi:MAG: hypothetical protein ACM3SY_04950 [Candidatus Omnitrophota bacterium]
MDDKAILGSLRLISDNLDHIETYIHANNWEKVGLATTQVKALQVDLAAADPDWDRRLAQNPTLKNDYQALRDAIITKTERIVASIQGWKSQQLEKISASRNVLDNLSRFYKSSTQSYYIDTKE